MKEFFKRLFCDHDFKRIDNFMSTYMTNQTKCVYYKCEKCGKISKVRVPWL